MSKHVHFNESTPISSWTLRMYVIFALVMIAGITIFALPKVANAQDSIAITVDGGGPDDEPSQSDVSLLGFDASHLPDYYFAQIQFDDTAYPGGNSGDGCIFFDSDDAEGFSDFAVCGAVLQKTITGVVELQAAAM